MAINPELTRAIELAAAGKGDAAREIVERLAKAGDPDALYAFADMHWRGTLVERDWAKAFELFNTADEAGSVSGGRVVTNLLASGLGTARNWPLALERLEREAVGDQWRMAAWRLIEAMDLDASGDPSQLDEDEQLLASPDLRQFRSLFSPAECQYLCALAEPMMVPSLVTGPNLEQIPDPIRTSECATLQDLIEDPAVHALNRRLAAASGSDYLCGEPLLILRYRPGQHYLNHLDALPGLENQRVNTVLVYLNAEYEGGQTVFPATGLAYRGQVGDAIVFRNVLDDGRADPASVHAGLSVLAGEKYLASRWIRQRPMFDENGPLGD